MIKQTRKSVFLALIILVVLVAISCHSTQRHTKSKEEPRKTSAMEILNFDPESPSTKAEGLKLLEKMGFSLAHKKIMLKDAPIQTKDGQMINLSDFKGKLILLILLHIWGSWCPSCKGELPSVERFYTNNLPEGTELVTCGFPRAGRETLGTINRFMEKNNYTFPAYFDMTGQLYDFYGTGSVPTTYIIDPTGEILALAIGAFEWNAPAFLEVLETLKPEETK